MSEKGKGYIGLGAPLGAHGANVPATGYIGTEMGAMAGAGGGGGPGDPPPGNGGGPPPVVIFVSCCPAGLPNVIYATFADLNGLCPCIHNRRVTCTYDAALGLWYGSLSIGECTGGNVLNVKVECFDSGFGFTWRIVFYCSASPTTVTGPGSDDATPATFDCNPLAFSAFDDLQGGCCDISPVSNNIRIDVSQT